MSTKNREMVQPINILGAKPVVLSSISGTSGHGGGREFSPLGSSDLHSNCGMHVCTHAHVCTHGHAYPHTAKSSDLHSSRSMHLCVHMPIYVHMHIHTHTQLRQHRGEVKPRARTSYFQQRE